MADLFLQIAVSLDGLIEGPDQDLIHYPALLGAVVTTDRRL